MGLGERKCSRFCSRKSPTRAVAEADPTMLDGQLFDFGFNPKPEANVGRLDRFAARASFAELCQGALDLHEFASRGDCNVYQRVRAIFQAHAIYRYLLPQRPELPRIGTIPRNGQDLLLRRHFGAAADVFLEAARKHGLNDPIASALSAAYYGLGFQLLASQVQHSVRSLRGNRWMFRMGHALDHPLRIKPELLQTSATGLLPVLVEKTPVRMDLSHSGWSDIFFLGMDYPEGARVLNVSVDLAVVDRDPGCAPPITSYLRIIDEPVLRLVSVDLDTSATLTEVSRSEEH